MMPGWDIFPKRIQEIKGFAAVLSVFALPFSIFNARHLSSSVPNNGLFPVNRRVCQKGNSKMIITGKTHNSIVWSWLIILSCNVLVKYVSIKQIHNTQFFFKLLKSKSSYACSAEIKTKG